MSAWYVWGALGLYPLTGTDQYFIGSPAVDKATVTFSKGKDVSTSYMYSKHASSMSTVLLLEDYNQGPGTTGVLHVYVRSGYKLKVYLSHSV